MPSVWTMALATDLGQQMAIRTILDAASIADPGCPVTQVRVKFEAHSSNASQIAGASIGLRSGATIDYQAGKFVRLLFSSANGVTIPAGGTVWSDWVNFSDFDHTVDHLVHIDMENVYGRYVISTGEDAYYKLGNLDDCMVQSPSGYTLTANRTYFTIELETNDASTTAAPTTVAPTTLAPTTIAPTTIPSTTLAPSTGPATTVPPTTLALTTLAPTTLASTTLTPTTVTPTTVGPTTIGPTTVPPTTNIPEVICIKNLRSVIIKEIRSDGHLC